MKKILSIVITVAMLAPLGVAAAGVAEETLTPVQIVDQWIEINGDIELDTTDEGFSQEAVNYRLALELVDLREQIVEFKELQSKNSWIMSIKAAWLEHKISVQLRRIAMLIRSSERRAAITEEIAEELSTYLDLIKEQIRE